MNEAEVMSKAKRISCQDHGERVNVAGHMAHITPPPHLSSVLILILLGRLTARGALTPQYS